MEKKNQNKTQRKQTGSGKLKSLKRANRTKLDVSAEEMSKVKGGYVGLQWFNRWRGFH
jgi:hypothetical protein